MAHYLIWIQSSCLRIHSTGVLQELFSLRDFAWKPHDIVFHSFVMGLLVDFCVDKHGPETRST
jgi:hypothetical protein